MANTEIPAIIKQLDEVLKVFHTTKKYKEGLYREDVKEEISFTNDEELNIILDRLRQDHYISNKPLSGSNREFITLNGVLHHLNGGYTGEIFMNARHARTERRLTTYTFWLAVGTFLIVLVETLIHWSEILHQLGLHPGTC